MPEIVIPCPKCGCRLRLPDRSFVGRKGRCPQCQLKFVMGAELIVDDADVPLMPPLPQQSGNAGFREGSAAATTMPGIGEDGRCAADEAAEAGQFAPQRAQLTAESRVLRGGPSRFRDQNPPLEEFPSASSPGEPGRPGEQPPVGPVGRFPADRPPAGDPAPRPSETVDFDRSTAAALSVMFDDIPEVFGRYRVLDLLGEGSMGAVYLAHDTELDRKVALKIPRFSDQDRSDETERFYREARAAATLRHPGICQVYDVGEIDGRHFIAMEYIDGNPLSAFIKQAKPQPIRKIAVTLRKLAKALQAAHKNGVVHRDLKPDNIMIDEKGEPIITDFGLVRLVDEDGRLTSSGAIVGSPPYMSPEQINAEADLVGPASDVFSLGTITYELLTRKRPFRGSLGRILEMIPTVDPEPPSKLRPDVDPVMESICLKMMAKRVSDRYASMNEVAEAVSAYLQQLTFDAGSAGRSAESAKSGRPPEAELPAALPVEAASVADGPDRRAANWVLSIGGTLKVSTESSKSVSVADAGGLPDGPFRVVDVGLLKNAQVDDAGMKHFTGLERLLVLRLSDTGVTDEGIAPLSKLTSLTVLDLSYTKVTDAGLRHVAGLTGLKQLDLANTKITDAGLAHVRRLTGLHFLGLYATGVTDAVVQALAGSNNLQFLGLYGTQVTDAGLAKLKKNLPNCTISR